MKLDELGGEYKALIKERTALRQKLKSELLKEHHNPHKDKQRTATILSLSQQETDLTQPELPDRSSRKMIFEVGSTQGIELAIGKREDSNIRRLERRGGRDVRAPTLRRENGPPITLKGSLKKGFVRFA